MTTPKAYTDNLNRRIITADMLADSLYSVNKRAKNCRDKERECRRNGYDAYDNASKYASKKEDYYRIKDELLSLLSPTCIHRVRHERICTIERDEYEYAAWLEQLGDAVIESYPRDAVDPETYAPVYAIRYREINYDYYLYYDLGTHSFHSPIDDWAAKKTYASLDMVDIDSLTTFGAETTDLISMPFVNKLLALIRSGDYTFTNR